MRSILTRKLRHQFNYHKELKIDYCHIEFNEYWKFVEMHEISDVKAVIKN